MGRNIVEIDISAPAWEQFFTLAPLVLIGTHDEDGSLDLAPKHVVTPMGWKNYFGFVCTPRQAQGDKPVIDYFQTFPVRKIDGQFIEDGYLYFECRHF